MALSHGAVKVVAGSRSGWAAAALSDGSIALVDATEGEAVLSDSLLFASSGVAMAADGLSLVAQTNGDDGAFATDRSLVRFSLYDGRRLKTWSYTYGTYPAPLSFTLSESGDALGVLLGTPGSALPRDWAVFDTASGSPLWSDVALSDVMHLSPDGARFAVPDSEASEVTVTRIYTAAGLADAAEGWAAGWFDDSRLLMNRYEASGTGTPTFVGAELFDVIGTVEPTGLPELTSIVPLSETELYAPDANIVYDVASGSVVWSTDDVLERGDCLGSRLRRGWRLCHLRHWTRARRTALALTFVGLVTRGSWSPARRPWWHAPPGRAPPTPARTARGTACGSPHRRARSCTFPGPPWRRACPSRGRP